MALMMKSCTFVVYHNGNKTEVLSQKILNLGFKLSKKPEKEGVRLTCEIGNPSRGVLDQFLDLIGMINKDENYKGSIEDASSLDSFEVISPSCSETSSTFFALGRDFKLPNGHDVRDNAIIKQERSNLYIETHCLGGREGEEGADETYCNSQMMKGYELINNDFDQGKEFECYKKDHERQHKKLQKETSLNCKEGSERKEAGLDKNSDFQDQKATISKTSDEENKAIDDSKNMVPYPQCGIQDKVEDGNKIPHKKVESAGENCQHDVYSEASENFEVQDSENIRIQKAKNEQEKVVETAGVDCVQSNMVPYPQCGIQDKVEDGNKIPHKKVESAGENCQHDVYSEASENFEVQDSENIRIQKAKNEQEKVVETAGVDCVSHSKVRQNDHGEVKENTEVNNQKFKQQDNNQSNENLPDTLPNDLHDVTVVTMEEIKKQEHFSESRQILKKEGGEIEDSIGEKAQGVATLTDPPQMPSENQYTFSNSGDSSIDVDSRCSKIYDAQEMEEERIENQEDENVENDDNTSDEDNKTTLIFSINTYRLASYYFKFSKEKIIWNYLEKAKRQKFTWLIEIDKEDCVKTLRTFQKEVISKKVSSEKVGIVMDINSFYGHNTGIVIVDHFDGYILLTAHTKIHEEIKWKFPDLDKVSESAPSMASGSESKKLKEQEQREKTDVDSKVVRTVKASWSEVSTKPSGEFMGHGSNFNVKVYSTNITSLRVDVIVNAANSRLQGVAGVAKAIFEAGGEMVKRECEKHISKKQRIAVTEHFDSDGGNLPAKRIYHALGPKWKFYLHRPEECKRDLVLTILQCLVHAEKDGHESIAFPSISSAYFGVPKDICAESYMKALRLFEGMRLDYKVEERLNEVHFVDINPDMVQSIRNYFTDHWDTPIYSYQTLVAVVDGVFKNFEISRKNKNKRIAPPDPSGQGASSSHGGARPKYTPMAGHTDSSLQRNDDECDICKEEGGQKELLRCCRKFLCKECLSKMQRCPYCQEAFGILHGDQPSGYMTAKKDPHIHLDGYKKHGTYIINYFFNEISNTRPYRVAYLPGTEKGLKALQLLMLAFRRRLTFTKGTSRTTGKDNRIVWNDIHHKTSLLPNNAYGYPDDKYLNRLKFELQSKGVTRKSMTKSELTDIDEFVKGLQNKENFKIF